MPRGYNGWAVKVRDKTKTEYAPIFESILGQPVTGMYNTFSGCTSLEIAPTIPSSVTNMSYTFQGCSSLVTAPTIPNGVTTMEHGFSGCKALTAAPTIPSSVTNLRNAFVGCTFTGTISVPCTADTYFMLFNTSGISTVRYHVDGCDGSCGY